MDKDEQKRRIRNMFCKKCKKRLENNFFSGVEQVNREIRSVCDYEGVWNICYAEDLNKLNINVKKVMRRSGKFYYD